MWSPICLDNECSNTQNVGIKKIEFIENGVIYMA